MHIHARETWMTSDFSRRAAGSSGRLGPESGIADGPLGPQGPGGRRKGSRWRHWTWKKALAVTGGAFVFLALVLFGTYEYLAGSAKIPAVLASANYQDTIVYYSDGKTVLGAMGPVNRQDLAFSQIPTQLQNAVLAAEDKDFWTESGISPTGVLSAAIHGITSGGGDLNGGSAITRGLVRNYYEGFSKQTASNKIKEIFIVQKLAGTKSKQWILANYLNVIYLGHDSYGVAAAAQTYFGVPVSQLTIAQDAVLASFIQQPSNYPLPQYRADLKGRWSAVLGDMVRDGFITQAQADAQKFPKLLTDSGTTSSPAAPYTASSSDPWAPYIMQAVYGELTAPTADGGGNVPVREVETGGLRVVTTISYPMEKALYKAVDANIAAIKATPGAQFPSYIRIGAELQNPSNGGIIAMYPGPGQDMSTAQCKEWDCNVNTALYTREQAGPSFTPYVLAAAVADGMNAQTSTLNSSPYLCVPPDSEQLLLPVVEKSLVPLGDCPQSGWFPVENDGGELIGNSQGDGVYTSSVQSALAQSSNTAFTDLTHRVTTSNVIKMARSFGVSIADYPAGSGLASDVGETSIALGIAPLTVNEQATMLSAIADNGVYHQAHIVTYWQRPNGPGQTPVLATHGVLDPSNPKTNARLDSQVQYAMEMTTVDGTGTSAAHGLGSRQIIAETGTTAGHHSGFFIGAIPQYALVVGMFTIGQSVNSPNNLSELGGGSDGYWPAKIWNAFAQEEFANLPQANFQSPVFTGANWNQVG
jgi:membrane peptidoglycan carboxypeptidase